MRLGNIIIDISSVLYKNIIIKALLSIDISVNIIQCNNDNITEYFEQEPYNLAIVDDTVYCRQNFKKYEALKNVCPNIPVIMLFNSDKEKVLDDARKKGVVYCLKKSLNESLSRNETIISRSLRMMLEDIFFKNELQPFVTFSSKSNYSALLIAASTGGPRVIEGILAELPENFPLPILIVQHMPETFTASFAGNLDKKCAVKVKEAVDNDIIKNGIAYIAPGGTNMYVTAQNRILLDEKEIRNGVRPSADILFESAAKAYKGKKVIAVILTGMGSDGTLGVQELKNNCHCFCIAQSEASCTVFGMPREVIENRLCDKVLDAKKIAEEIMLQLRLGESIKNEFE